MRKFQISNCKQYSSYSCLAIFLLRSAQKALIALRKASRGNRPGLDFTPSSCPYFSIMDNEKGAFRGNNEGEMTQTHAPTREQRIQFKSHARPTRSRKTHRDDDNTANGHPITSRSVASIPRVITPESQNRLKSEMEHAEKHVDLDEHLLSHLHVAERYKTKINMEKPDASLGLASQDATDLLLLHGPNTLTPIKKRSAWLKYWDFLTTLFNLLLIFAGVLEYILLGIDYNNNFQNVS
jgi:sodium/potassium-transporting ATPase subunit alpha